MNPKKIFFASDVHLGASALNNNNQREKLFVQWLDEIKDQAEHIYLLGDIFDFWYEYKSVVPKGFTRTLGKLAEISDSGVKIHFFTGNHDIWAFDYLEKEIGLKIYRDVWKGNIGNKKFYIAHGDGLGEFDKGYKILKKLFTNKILQWCFSLIHPDLSFYIANKWSSHSRLADGKIEADTFRGEDKEWLVIHAKEELKKEHFDFFMFGHRHLPGDIKLNEKSRYINTGDWISFFSYAEFDGDNMKLLYYKGKEQK